MKFSEALRSSAAALRANMFRTLLTALGLVIGNASVILVVTISLTGTSYILEQIRGIGSNVIWAYYDAGSRDAQQAQGDFVKVADVAAIREQLAGRIVAATAVMGSVDTVPIAGREQEISVQGADEYYPMVRNLVILAGRFMDTGEVAGRAKVAMLTERLAHQLFGGQQAAIGQVMRVKGLQFTVIGTFKERTPSFGLSELAERTVLIPISVLRYFVPVERVDPVYVQARDAADVPRLTAAVRTIIENRHRPGARYYVDNLAAILEAAENIGLILTLVLILVSAIALVISGIGIMNIMLVTVSERTREVGLRMAVGAARREVLTQFLLEAVIISVGGGMVGIALGIAGPLAAREFAEGLDIRVSWISVAVAFGVSFAVGLIFGLLPARRAARLQPTEALRYE
ncbi:MAG: FtsX-like permease family protein [Acidobacteria bacterium]|nr:FtsX-like permease family protein [Acidobacteriota bacterium]